ncbi:MAG: hypothetical protein FWD06_08165 [Oscillospiraceae bacterium]|nr:hypothetical protein [Oscillospiraceae bacterium]
MSTIQVHQDDQLILNDFGMNSAEAVRMLLRFALQNHELFLKMQQQEEDEFSRLRPETQQAVIDARLRQNLFGPYKTAQEAVAAMLED